MHTFAQTGRRLTTILFIVQSLGSAGFITATTINSIVGAELSGQPTWAGLPSGVYLLGSALAALVWGYAMERFGRRVGMAWGLVAGVAGAALAALAVIGQSFGLLLAGLALMGTAQAAVQFGRFIAAEVHVPAERGRAISNVVLGGTVGAIFGPQMVVPGGLLMRWLGFPELAGPYLISLLLFVVAVVTVVVLLRPEPREVGRELARLVAAQQPMRQPDGPPRALGLILRQPAVIVAVLTMVLSQVTMVMLMVITALHMRDHNHSLGSVSLVLSSHTVGMFAFSIVSGRLADWLGRAPVIAIGAATLTLACLLAPLSPAVLPIAVALFLLGLGWNFCFVGGSSLLADQLSPAESAKTQGVNDLLIGLTSALGSVGSGVIFASLGYAIMGLVGAVAALVALGLALWWMVGQRRAVSAV